MVPSYTTTRHHAGTAGFRAIARDDALRFVGVFGPHGDPHVADAIHHQRKNRSRHIGRQQRRDAVRLQQPFRQSADTKGGEWRKRDARLETIAKCLPEYGERVAHPVTPASSANS